MRDFNLREWQKGPGYYFGRPPTWWKPESEILRAIDHPTFDVQALLDGVPVYPADDDGIRRAWAHHMALHAGCHPWPNANHRTAMLCFNFALAAAQSRVAGFSHPERGEELVRKSHARRDGDGGEYTRPELIDPKHPYRLLFETFSRELVLLPSADAGKLAKFGPRTE